MEILPPSTISSTKLNLLVLKRVFATSGVGDKKINRRDDRTIRIEDFSGLQAEKLLKTMKIKGVPVKCPMKETPLLEFSAIQNWPAD